MPVQIAPLPSYNTGRCHRETRLGVHFMTFPISLDEIDALAKQARRPVAHEMSGLFWRAVEAEGTPPERADALRLLGLALSLSHHLHAQSSSRPFGKVGTNNLLTQLTVEQAQSLAALAPTIENSEVRAIVADVAWSRARGTPEIARVAVAAYLASARNLEDPEQWSEGLQRAERALRLSRSLGADEQSHQDAIAYLLEILDRYRGEDPLFLTGRTIELLLEFGVGEPAGYLEHAGRAADRARGRNNFHLARYYYDLLAKIHRAQSDEAGTNAALRAIANTFESEARLRESGGDHLAAAHFFTHAIQAHRRVPGSDTQVAALRPELQRAERASIAQFKRIEGPTINLAEYALRARERVAGQELRVALVRLAHIHPLADPAAIRSAVVEAAKLSPLRHMLTAGVTDSAGRTVGIAPGMRYDQGAEHEALFAQIVEQMGYQRGCVTQGFIVPALLQVTLEHAITAPELMALCAYSPFVPPGHEGIFAEGLLAGFQQDFMSAAHLLVPQIENSLRYLLNERNVITTKLDRFGVQRQIDLSDLVLHDQLPAILSPSIILELRTLLSDNRGPNLRHLLAHGMLDDDAFASAEVIYAWWLTLALCFFNRPVRAEERSERTEASPEQSS